MLVENEKFGITHRNSRTQFIQCLPVWRLTISYVLPSIPPVAVILIFSDRTEGQLCKTFCVLNIEILGLTVLQVASPRGLLTLKQRVVLRHNRSVATTISISTTTTTTRTVMVATGGHITASIIFSVTTSHLS